ncbi:ABC transporter DrrB family efflux protein [Hamadaea flava]|uniref:Transport permease protein n=1 Tax=Hamadaea flava TaxID=1742688 RepID=A0ABV8LUL8_9ACTN|nr:ABC transporter permease [Hamadaea flava]MCP2327437.1 ABC transporter DrrB family efflux protein [Hamadaea flava]
MTTLSVTSAVPSRVSPLTGLKNTATLAWRSLVSIKHNPFEIIDLSIQPLMFLLLFTYTLGGAIAGSTDKYLAFALPGILVQNTIFATMNIALLLNNDLTKGVFDRLRSLPISRWSPLAGRILADTVKQAWSVALLLGFGLILGFRVQTSFWGVLGTFGLMLVFCLCVAWIAVLVGVVASAEDKVQIFMFSFMFPLTFTSNIFAPTESMPGWLQSWVKINPVTILADAVRAMLNGGNVATPVLQSLAWAAAILAVFAPLAVWRFKRRV